MKHLKNLNGIEELSNNELKNTDGGVVLGVDCLFVAGFAAGAAITGAIAYVIAS